MGNFSRQAKVTHMPANLLSAAEVKNAASTGSSIRKLADGDGLALWTYPDGRKYWRLRYWYLGKEKLLSVGVYPRVSLADARKKRDALLKQLDAGLDPSHERQAKKRAEKLAAANSFEVVAREWFGKQKDTWVDSHTLDVKRRLEGNLFPVLGARLIGEIDAQELLAAVRKIEGRGAHDLAHRVLGVAGQVLRYGIATGRCTRDWSADLKGALTPAVKKNQAAVSAKELPDLLRAVAAYEAIGGDKQTRLGLQLLAHTFTRTGELINATWNEFDFDNALWAIPPERMKMGLGHLVPLSTQALAILSELKVLAGDSKFVLPGRSNAKPISSNTLLFALYRLGYKSRMTGHGFRSVASTILNESGLFNPDWIERQLAHVEGNSVRGAYNRAAYLQDRAKMMTWWSDHLDKLVSGNVLPLKKKHLT
jgi:integrase